MVNSMNRRKYDISIVFNEIEIKKDTIDPHFELKHVERFREGKYGTIRVSFYQLKEGILND